MNNLEKYKVNVETTSKKDILEFVSAVITNKKGNVLLLKRCENLKLDPGKYDMCSGHMKEGEVSIFSMLREIKEELGVDLEEINSIKSIGTIPTPHEKFLNTQCHMYHVVINLPEEEIKKRIKNVEEPEIEDATFLDNIDVLLDLQKNSNIIRTIYTKDLERILNTVKETIENKNKEETCEER